MRSVVWFIATAACGSGGHSGSDASQVDDGIDESPTDGSNGVTSCSGLASTCGPMANESCCASALLPGGTFSRGWDAAMTGSPPSTTNATVSAFRLDRFEV